MTSTTAPTPTRSPLHLPFILVVVLAAVGMLVVGALHVFAPPAADGFATFFLAVMSVVISFAALVYNLGKQEQTLQEIRSNTNGTLSAERSKSAALEAQLLQAGHTPVTTGAAPF